MSEQAAPSSSGGSSGAAPIVQRCFAETTLDATIYYQIMDIGKQLFIWVRGSNSKADKYREAVLAMDHSCQQRQHACHASALRHGRIARRYTGGCIVKPWQVAA